MLQLLLLELSVRIVHLRFQLTDLMVELLLAAQLLLGTLLVLVFEVLELDLVLARQLVLRLGLDT